MLSRARAHMPNGTPMAWMASEYDQPVYVSHGQGAGFTDVDGFTYLDFNASDMSMFCGHANPAIVAAVQAQVARSSQFLLPTEASVEVAEELSRRYQLPHWQFTLSATQANTEAIRLARAVTGREVVVLFEGHYHGHLEEGWWTWPTARPGQCSVACPRGRPAGCGSPSSTAPARCGRRSNPATWLWC
jgi:glutamate-1-semialdehyde 2,1-aminomutase